jgi:aspartyl-tRNA(Asn)/glutamyl-tRNA(Gln) amidotransferase subunit A
MEEIAKENDILNLITLIKSKKISPVELTKHFLGKIEKKEKNLQAWVTVTAEEALERAKQIEKKIVMGENVGLLAGIPFSAKDIFCTRGIKTTSGSKVMADFVPDYNATAISLLEQEDAILLGKTTTTEFAFGRYTETRNPWNINHSPGGSSSGSAAAVASGMSAFALGTQTGGSLLRPSAYCGLVSLKATLGRLSRHGVFPCSWTLDHIGPMTKNIREQALLLHILSGYDKNDSISLNIPKIDKDVARLQELSGVTIGVPTSYFFDDVEEDVKQSVEAGIQKLANQGARIVEIDLPEIFEASIAAHTIISHAEASSYHKESFKNDFQKYGPFLQERLAVGRTISATTYLKAHKIRTLYIQALNNLLEKVTVFIVPSAPNTAPISHEGTGDPKFNSPFTMAGVPSLTIPCGLGSNGLPIGMQIVGKVLSEELLLSIGAYCEEIFNFNKELVNNE